jgi:hypothetical protein
MSTQLLANVLNVGPPEIPAIPSVIAGVKLIGS